MWCTKAWTPPEPAREAFEELVRSGQVPRSKRGGGRFGPRVAEEEPAPLALDDVDAAGTLTRYLALSSVMCILGLV